MSMRAKYTEGGGPLPPRAGLYSDSCGISPWRGVVNPFDPLPGGLPSTSSGSARRGPFTERSPNVRRTPSPQRALPSSRRSRRNSGAPSVRFSGAVSLSRPILVMFGQHDFDRFLDRAQVVAA